MALRCVASRFFFFSVVSIIIIIIIAGGRQLGRGPTVRVRARSGQGQSTEKIGVALGTRACERERSRALRFGIFVVKGDTVNK